MTVASSTSRVEYSGNGVTTVFPFANYFIQNSDLVVVLRVTSTGVETVKTITTHYTVSGAGNEAGGSVTMLTAPAAGETLTIYRNPEFVQEIDLVENDPLPAETVEEGLDLLTMQTQRVNDLATRSVRLSDAFPTADFSPILPSVIEAEKVLSTNAAGDAFELTISATDVANASTYAAQAAASAASALSAAATFGRDVSFKVFGDSPITVSDSDRGLVFSCDCTGGNIVVNLPAISGVSFTTPYVIHVKKSDSSVNTVTINRASTDTIDGATSKTLTTQGQGCFLIPDAGPVPDIWTSIDTVQIAQGTVGRVAAMYDFVVGSSAQVTAGVATHSTWASAITAASAGDSILILEGAWTENVTVSKQLLIEGHGYGSNLTGSITFNSSSDRSYLSNVRLSDNMTFDSGADLIKVENVWFAASKSFIDNGTGNVLEGFQE